MNIRSQLFSICAALLGGMAFPAAAAPYLVYSGTVVQTSDISPAEGKAVLAKVNANLTQFHKVDATLQRDVTTTATKQTATTKNTVYLIVDEQNLGTYTFVIIDPSGYAGYRIASFPSNDQSANAIPENFVNNGFQFPTTGGLGIFRLGFVHSTGTDPVTGAPGSFLLQAYGTGELNYRTNAEIVGGHVEEAFWTIVNGARGAEHILPATPAVVSATGTSYTTKITGTVLGYYLDDNATQSLGGASTSGTFALVLDGTLTHLANFQGEYEANSKNIGLIQPISASTPAAFTAWAKSILAVVAPLAKEE
jgi:hypothetical protein